MPFADQHTDLHGSLVSFPWRIVKYQIGPGPLVWSGELHALIPLMLERLGPLGELLVIQLPIGLDRTHHMPVLTAAEFEQAIGEQLPSCRKVHRPANQRATAAVTLRASLGPASFSCESGAAAQGSALDGDAARSSRGGRAANRTRRTVGQAPGGLPHVRRHWCKKVSFCLDSWCGHGGMRPLQDAGTLIFFAQRIIEAHIESPLVGLVSIRRHIRHDKVAQWSPEVFGCPGTEAQRVRPIRGVGGIDAEALEPGNGCMPDFRDNQDIGQAQYMLPLWLTQT